jgi:hypothetical protein
MSNIAVILASVLSSGVIAALIGSSFGEAKERWILRRSKIEEIYLNAATWLKSVNADFLLPLRVCAGKITYNEMLDLQINRENKSLGDHFLRMKMNIQMYELSLVPALELMERELKKTNKINSAVKACWIENGEASELLEPLNRQLVVFDAAGEALKKAIVLRGAAIGAEKAQMPQAYEWAKATISGHTKRLIAKSSAMADRVWPSRKTL